MFKVMGGVRVSAIFKVLGGIHEGVSHVQGDGREVRGVSHVQGVGRDEGVSHVQGDGRDKGCQPCLR